jgi:hypothetical protein
VTTYTGDEDREFSLRILPDEIRSQVGRLSPERIFIQPEMRSVIVARAETAQGSVCMASVVSSPGTVGAEI